jgi:hypothetical protein
MCKEKGCKIRPSFNLEGQTTGIYCFTHKLEGMVDVIHKTCLSEGCNKRPNFNIEGQSNALYCATHKLEGMVDVKNKTCLSEGCKIRPTYNLEGQSKTIYCFTHKLEGMVDVKHKTCLSEGCNKQPNYNLEGQPKAIYCATHKLEGMVDVKSKRCLSEGCKIIPNYNLDGQSKGIYCATHKLEGMVDVKHKTCLSEGCKIMPNYNLEGQSKGIYCATHKLEGMVDVKHKTCLSEWCSTQVQEKYDGYCLFCYMNLFPDKPVSRNYKTKEYSVVDYVKTKFPDVEWIADKKISGGCSKRRPDLLLDLLYQIIIVEVDENQHIDYDCSCQNKRIMELSQDLGHRPIIFIRFNPDEYTKDGKNIASCWGQNKTGICVVKKSKKDEWSHRLTVLENNVNYWINPENVTGKTIEIIQLFYDE